MPPRPVPSCRRCRREADRLCRWSGPQAVPPRPGDRGRGAGTAALLRWALTFPTARASTDCDRQATLLRGGIASTARPCCECAEPWSARSTQTTRGPRRSCRPCGLIRRYPADANVEAWLVTIAHRKVIDLVRKAKRSATPVAEVPAAATELDFDGSEIDLAKLLSSAARATALGCRLPLPRRPAVCGGGGSHRGQPRGRTPSRGRRDRQAPQRPGPQAPTHMTLKER